MRRSNPSRICSRHGLALSASSGGMEENREKREERREKKAYGRKLDSLKFYMVPEGRDGAEKGRALGERTEERKENEKRKTITIKMRGPQKAIVRSKNGAAKDRGCWERRR